MVRFLGLLSRRPVNEKNFGCGSLIEAFIARYGDTFYAELARARLREIEQEKKELQKPITTSLPAGGLFTEKGEVPVATKIQPPTSEKSGSGVFRIHSVASWDKDCVADPLPEVLTIKPPKHGKIVFGEGTTRVTRIIGNDRKCMGSNMRGRQIYYVPAGEQAKSDEVSFVVLTVRGRRWNLGCTIRIPERQANCRRN